MFTQNDIRQIEGRGSSVRQVEQQIATLSKGFPWMKIVGPATPERGILVLSETSAQECVEYYRSARVDGRCKFVPASGAASRMFKDMFAGLHALEEGKPLPAPAARLVEHIREFAFYDEGVFAPGDEAKDILEKLLTDKGLGYGAKPKGVLRFHRYADEIRTAIAEHLVEAATYMKDEDDLCHLTITISPEHRPLFEAAISEVREKFEARYGVRYDIRFQVQAPATDTIAVDPRNKPFRKGDGSLLFRPAGHGALIYNLNNVEEELVSIKNIDNVAHARMLPVTARWKKVLMGRCLELRDTIFEFLRGLDAESDPASDSCRRLCDRIESFLDRVLCIQLPLEPNPADRVALLRSKLDRPIRVCGMVRNEGEPGGGPFIIAGKDGSSNLQILESVQIDPSSPRSADILSRATHFNPVDLVCCLRNYKGEKFDLLRYVDEEAGFISSKSYQGRPLRALELPGLWNGAMSDWNTLFVEVPLETFNPVKVVLDLLRPAHQA